MNEDDIKAEMARRVADYLTQNNPPFTWTLSPHQECATCLKLADHRIPVKIDRSIPRDEIHLIDPLRPFRHILKFKPNDT